VGGPGPADFRGDREAAGCHGVFPDHHRGHRGHRGGKGGLSFVFAGGPGGLIEGAGFTGMGTMEDWGEGKGGVKRSAKFSSFPAPGTRRALCGEQEAPRTRGPIQAGSMRKTGSPANSDRQRARTGEDA